MHYDWLVLCPGSTYADGPIKNFKGSCDDRRAVIHVRSKWKSGPMPATDCLSERSQHCLSWCCSATTLRAQGASAKSFVAFSTKDSHFLGHGRQDEHKRLMAADKVLVIGGGIVGVELAGALDDI